MGDSAVALLTAALFKPVTTLAGAEWHYAEA
jgi:hypothetical protein